MTDQKNIIYGNITGVGGNVTITDQTDIHLHLPTQPLSKELTWNLPRTHPDDIIGREHDLTQLRDSLHTRKKVVVVNGLGGIGKTTLAEAYISRYYAEYKHIAWINHDSTDIANDFANESTLIKNLSIGQVGTDTQSLFREIVRNLKAISDHPNLLVIDNAGQGIEQLLDVLPGQPNWHLLATSRETIPGFHTQSLDTLAPADAVALFKKYYTFKQLTDPDIQRLVEAVDCHTLTIELLAKTALTRSLDLAALQRVIFGSKRLGIPSRYPSGSFERIAAQANSIFSCSRLSRKEIHLLQQFTCLPSNFQDYNELQELLLDGQSRQAVHFPTTLSQLVQKGWLSQDETGRFKMHRIIAGVVRKAHPIKAKHVKNMVVHTTGKLELAQPGENPIEKFRWIPYGQALLDSLPDDRTIEIAVLQNNLALRKRDQGEYPDAKQLLEKSIRIKERSWRAGAESLAAAYSNLSTILSELGEYPDAKLWIERAIRLTRRMLGPDHPDVRNYFSNLAVALNGLGQIEDARDILQDNARYYSRRFGEDHPVTIRAYSNLAMTVAALGDTSSAGYLMEKATHSAGNNLGNDHILTITTLLNQAALLEKTKDHHAAELTYKRVMHLVGKTLGDDHPLMIKALSGTGRVLREINDHSHARDMLYQAVSLAEKKLGTWHIDTGTAYSGLALVLYEQGENAQALECARRALTISKNIFPPGHHHIQYDETIYRSLAAAARDGH